MMLIVQLYIIFVDFKVQAWRNKKFKGKVRTNLETQETTCTKKIYIKETS